MELCQSGSGIPKSLQIEDQYDVIDASLVA